MTRLHGRARRGERCSCAVPHGHWHTATLVVALRHDRLCAPCVLDGPMNGPAFLAWVTQFLAPELRPGDIVICDNLSSHKVAGVAQAIEARGARLLYLPAYSPDLNPIEMAFAKLKAFLRQAAQRSYEGLESATADALESFTPDHCANFLRHANYATN
ncbi:MAG: superendonuclease family protein [Verrucomicrobiales bacterium]|nr:superendonuclease family protein [Verrucomicrobiales bacterium]